MKKLLMLALILLPASVYSHPGGLDADGGHVDKRTGEYHYHKGPQAKKPSGQSLIGIASVIDGDTIEIHGQRIRLHGIDAPESAQLCKVDSKPWRCGHDAAIRLSDKIGKKTVSCEQKDKDRYGRVVAVCSAGGEDLNGWMVSEGLAVAYRQYSKDYVGQEEKARAAGLGIWGSEFEMPWEYRRK